MVRFTVFMALMNACSALTLKGKLTGIPEYQLEFKDKFMNGDNLSGRCSVKLTSLEDTIISTLVKSNYEFQFFEVPEGEYNLFVSCHDFLFTKDRYKIEVNETNILATHYYLDKEETDTPIDITNDTLSLNFGGLKRYYEIRQGSIQTMIMNSPLGFIFKNTTYTIMFIFCVFMMIGPTVLKMVSPEFAKKLEDIQKEAREQPSTHADPIRPKVPAKELPPNSNIRKRK